MHTQFIFVCIIILRKIFSSLPIIQLFEMFCWTVSTILSVSPLCLVWVRALPWPRETIQALLAGVPGVFSRGPPVFASLLISPSHMSLNDLERDVKLNKKKQKKTVYCHLGNFCWKIVQQKDFFARCYEILLVLYMALFPLCTCPGEICNLPADSSPPWERSLSLK